MENWKPIPNYEGLYDASDLGRIRTHPNKITSNARYEKRVWKSRIMKPKHPVKAKRKDGRVSLWKDGASRDYLVARLVAAAWIREPAEGETVNHINGDWTDNRSCNLEWVSLKENIRHGYSSGLYDSICVKTILERCSDGERACYRSLADASRSIGRSRGYLSNVVRSGRRKAKSDNGVEYTIEVSA